MIASSVRPLTPPALLMRSIAIWRPTTAVLPPSAAAPESGCNEPILYGAAAPKAAPHGAGTSIAAPSAPPPQPTNVRRVTLPLYQKSCAQSCSFHFSVIANFSFYLCFTCPNKKAQRSVAHLDRCALQTAVAKGPVA